MTPFCTKQSVGLTCSKKIRQPTWTKYVVMKLCCFTETVGNSIRSPLQDCGAEIVKKDFIV